VVQWLRLCAPDTGGLCSIPGQATSSHVPQLRLYAAKFRLKLKKVGKITRPFRYDLNQIPYDYTMEVTNRYKGLALIDRVPKTYGQKFVTLYRRQ